VPGLEQSSIHFPQVFSSPYPSNGVAGVYGRINSHYRVCARAHAAQEYYWLNFWPFDDRAMAENGQVRLR
jgi:hypothetical protein